jgi:hypothetical protein
MKKRKVITPKAKRPAEKNGISVNNSSTCVGQLKLERLHRED